MELILQKGLSHQEKPVQAISEVFKGVVWKEDDLSTYKNPLIDFEATSFQQSLRDVIRRYNGVLDSVVTPPSNCLNLDIKMETGTGKTYVYTNTIYELHKQFGVNKFVICVPSLPIKAGTAQFIGDSYVLKHFQDTCNYGARIELNVLKAVKKKKGKQYFPSPVRAFVEASRFNTNKISVLLVNAGLLRSGTFLTRDDYDFGAQGYYSPLEAIKSTRPFVIIDEPHRFSREDKTYKIIEEKICPQCVIRFGATFPKITIGSGRNKRIVPDYQNVLYNLTAFDSFSQNLIKGISKEHFNENTGSQEKIKVISISNRESVSVNHITSTSTVSRRLVAGDSLGILSDKLSGLSIVGIGKDFIELSNGQIKRAGEEFMVDIFSTSYQEQMLKLAIQRHFETERINFERSNRIKTLALFFIDNIESYRGNEDGQAWLRDTFDRLLAERLDEELKKENSADYDEFLVQSKQDLAACRAGYFAQDNSDSEEAIEKEVNDILHNKKQLLSFRNPDGTWNTRRFLFSKWTLKEGWDNPNVFTITKLRSSGSENSKLQEVGRGLRLPVDENGARIDDEDFMLNYIVDFTEADFANQLVREINGDLPAAVQILTISDEEMQRVAALRGKDAMALMFELYSKKYIIDTNKTINTELLNEFYENYPEFVTSQTLPSGKIIDRNKGKKTFVKIRKDRYNELKTLWELINQRYVIFLDDNIDAMIEKALPSLFDGDTFTERTVTSTRSIIAAANGQMESIAGSGVDYTVTGKPMSYSIFLKKINRATSIPIKSLHKAICAHAKSHPEFCSRLINEASMAVFIQKFMDWRTENLLNRLNYKKADYKNVVTSLTKPDGTLREEIVQGSIGVHIDKSATVSAKYLYENLTYDSPLERTNILAEPESVVVYGKIPRKSIAIPTIGDSSYSPDFMYVVKKQNGDKELNLVIETKDVENKTALRGEEKVKIGCAERFFEQLQADGYNVKFRTQLNNRQMQNIINDLIISDGN